MRCVAQPFAWAELDAALQRVEPTAPIVQLFNGGPLAEERYTDVVVELGAPRRRLTKRRFYAELKAGATLVVNGFEHHSPTACGSARRCGRFCASVAQRRRANAYLLDRRARHVRPALGHARRVRAATPRPQALAGVRADVSAAARHASQRGRRADGAATPVLDCVLEAGDLLYVPRGWWHHVLPEEGPSLHLSIGTYAPTVHDYLSWACARHLPAALAARRSLGAASADEHRCGAVEAFRVVVLPTATRAEFEREAASRERSRTDLAHGAAPRESAPMASTPGDLVSMNAAHRLDITATEIAVRGGRLRLHPLARSIVAALGRRVRCRSRALRALGSEHLTRSAQPCSTSPSTTY